MRQRKKLISSGATSQHVIDLRAQSIDAQSPSVTRAPRQFFSWLQRRAPARAESHDHVPETAAPRVGIHPAVDFAHVERVFVSGEIVQKEEPLTPMTRWRRAFVDLTLVEVAAVFGLAALVRVARRFVHIPVSFGGFTFDVAPIRIGVLKHCVIFLIVASMLATPIGVMSAWGQIVVLQALIGVTRPRAEAAVRAIVSAVSRGAWDDVVRAAEQLSTHVDTLEHHVATTPPILRRILGFIPRLGGVARAGEAAIHDGQVAARAFVDVARGIAAERGHVTMETFHRVAPALTALLGSAAQLDANLSHIAGVPLPSSVRADILSATTALSSWRTLIADAQHAAALADAGLGFDQSRRYLILFQNPNEQRGTGGFLGSYGVVDVEKGRVVRWTIPPEGTYGLRRTRTARVAAPRPLQLINAEWEFQDANWWPEWPVTAKKILWFWETAQQPPVDGILLVNGTLLTDVLRIVGPIVLRDGTRLEADSALLTIERTILRERREDNRHQPKRILGTLADALTARLVAPSLETSIALGSALQRGLARREVMVWSNDAILATHIRALGWDGSRMPTTRDYLQVVHTNIGGGKTDAVVDDALAHTVFIQQDGTAVVTVALERMHRGRRGDQLTGVQNNDYVRAYVPAGAVLIDAWGFTTIPESQFESPVAPLAFDEDLGAHETAWRRDERTGIDMYREGGKTVFGGWMLTRPGDRSSAGLRYQLPFRVRADTAERTGVARLIARLRSTETFVPYDLLLVRQPGTRPRVTSTVTTPASWETVWRYPLTTRVTPATVSYEGALEDDLWLGAVWKEQ